MDPGEPQHLQLDHIARDGIGIQPVARQGVQRPFEQRQEFIRRALQGRARS